jgi:glutamate-1-semialdehyde 2,1-aminomutase
MMNLGVVLAQPGYLEQVREITSRHDIGGGLPSGAIGGSERVMSVVEDGTVYQVGTYNGNPLSMAASRTDLAWLWNMSA